MSPYTRDTAIVQQEIVSTMFSCTGLRGGTLKGLGDREGSSLEAGEGLVGATSPKLPQDSGTSPQAVTAVGHSANLHEVPFVIK